MNFPLFLALNLLFIIGTSLGGFLLLRPAAAIEMQKKFYKLINWRIEPISMRKELRNTRIMGAVFFLAALGAALYIFI